MRPLSHVAICTVFAILLAACEGSSGDQDRTVAGESVDPTAYRAEIQSLENSIYQAELDENARDAIAVRLSDLADKIALEDGAIVMIYSIEMRELGAFAKIGRDEHFVRENWERIRGGLFDDATWYRWRNAPHRPKSASRPKFDSDRAIHRDFDRVLRKLDDMVASGRREAERMGEPESLTREYFDNDYPNLVAVWDDWAGDWARKLAWLEDDLPDAPSYQESPALKFAARDLENAIRELRAVPTGRGQWKTPFRAQWDNSFTRAERHLSSARFQIEK
jgi:hypothetical protein